MFNIYKFNNILFKKYIPELIRPDVFLGFSIKNTFLIKKFPLELLFS